MGLLYGQEDYLALFLIVIIGIAFTILISAVPAWFIYKPLKRIPVRYHKIPTYLPWILTIPIVNIVITWIIIPFKFPETLKNYFSENHHEKIKENEDFGKVFGLGCAVSLTIFYIIPTEGLTFLSGISWIVFTILYLIKVNSLADLIQVDNVNQCQSSPPITPSSDTVSANSTIKSARNAGTTDEKFNQLEKLKKLFDDGTLDSEEFATEKKKILGS